MTLYHVGIDSTDSATLGMCTTYLGAHLIEILTGIGLKLTTYPELVRLNPNVPWKTRGNGAVCLRFEGAGSLKDKIFDASSELIDRMAILNDPQTNPGLALLMGDVPRELNDLYTRTVKRIVELDHVKTLAKEHAVRIRGWKNERGIIGATAAVGAALDHIHTYEVISYRQGNKKMRERSVDPDSLVHAQDNHPSTFFNHDKGKVLCIPHSPCPVIFGMRGLDPKDTLEAASEVISEEPERWVLWRTNQHSDAHITRVDGLEDIEDHMSVSMEGTVSAAPRYIEGGHLFFDIRDPSIACGAYEPTKTFRKQLARLIPGDVVRVWGGIRPADGGHPRAINLEKVEILRLETAYSASNPKCPKCGGLMISMGKDQGMRCRRCKHRDDQIKKERRELNRDLKKGLIEPPPAAWRHLYKPSSLPDYKEATFERASWGRGRPST